MEKGSLHPMGQVVTPHETKKKEVCGIDIQRFYHTLVPSNSSTKEDKNNMNKDAFCKKILRTLLQLLEVWTYSL